ncbi:hypothetical protein HQ576_14485 [bacterium]|nr:hypothetical protein [bacterium]
MIRITEPFHGAVLNHRHGVRSDTCLAITVRGEAPLGDSVLVNGHPARREGVAFVASLTLTDAETDIVATATGPRGTAQHSVRVVWDRHSRPRYRFSLDDNSFFLRDIADKQPPSLFDCFYLAGLRDLQRRYGTKFSCNIYYTTGDDFALPDFPDRYRAEWADNAHWLRLAFHAHANDPDRPYEHASPEKLIADLDLVAAEIRRFAGEAAYAPPTVIHWGLCPQTALPALASRGVRALSGYFGKTDGHYTVNYRLDDERSEYMSRHDALKDFASGIVFSRVDIVCNCVPLEQIVPTLAPLADDPDTAEIMDLFTHEQYFWPFYHNYVPDHFERLDAALRWATDHGYEPVFFHEGLLGTAEP